MPGAGINRVLRRMLAIWYWLLWRLRRSRLYVRTVLGLRIWRRRMRRLRSNGGLLLFKLPKECYNDFSNGRKIAIQVFLCGLL